MSHGPDEERTLVSRELWSQDEGARDAVFVVFILVSNKDMHFAALVDSLLRSDLEDGTRIVVSYDGENPVMRHLGEKLQQRFAVSHIVHPFACASAETRKGFPKYVAKRRRSVHKAICVKHHWFWAMHNVFQYFHKAQWLYYLEEDFLVSKHIGTVAKDLMRLADASDAYMGAMTQCRDNLWTVSGLLKRSAWHALLQRVEFFCTFDEYNW